MKIDPIEILALKKITIICGALADSLTVHSAQETRALVRVLLDVINRAEIDNARAQAEAAE